MTTCKIAGCEAPIKVKRLGWCNTHYQRWWKHGDPEKLLGHASQHGTPEVRFWRKVDRTGPDGCWLWLGKLGSKGYGLAHVENGQRQAHRVAYELAIGQIPDGLEMDHLCNVRRCVNPEHLEPVTHAENIRRRYRRERERAGR